MLNRKYMTYAILYVCFSIRNDIVYLLLYKALCQLILESLKNAYSQLTEYS